MRRQLLMKSYKQPNKHSRNRLKPGNPLMRQYSGLLTQSTRTLKRNSIKPQPLMLSRQKLDFRNSYNTEKVGQSSIPNMNYSTELVQNQENNPPANYYSNNSYHHVRSQSQTLNERPSSNIAGRIPPMNRSYRNVSLLSDQPLKPSSINYRSCQKLGIKQQIKSPLKSSFNRKPVIATVEKIKLSIRGSDNSPLSKEPFKDVSPLKKDEEQLSKAQASNDGLKVPRLAFYPSREGEEPDTETATVENNSRNVEQSPIQLEIKEMDGPKNFGDDKEIEFLKDEISKIDLDENIPNGLKAAEIEQQKKPIDDYTEVESIYHSENSDDQGVATLKATREFPKKPDPLISFNGGKTNQIFHKTPKNKVREPLRIVSDLTNFNQYSSKTPKMKKTGSFGPLPNYMPQSVKHRQMPPNYLSNNYSSNNTYDKNIETREKSMSTECVGQQLKTLSHQIKTLTSDNKFLAHQLRQFRTKYESEANLRKEAVSKLTKKHEQLVGSKIKVRDEQNKTEVLEMRLQDALNRIQKLEKTVYSQNSNTQNPSDPNNSILPELDRSRIAFKDLETKMLYLMKENHRLNTFISNPKQTSIR